MRSFHIRNCKRNKPLSDGIQKVGALTPALRGAFWNMLVQMDGGRTALALGNGKGPELEPLRVTVIDDNASDRYLLKQALMHAGLSCKVTEIGDGVAALAFCRRRIAASSAPEVIFLDINLPKCDGFEILRAIRSNPALTGSIVVMWSSSSYGSDIETAYRLGAHIYVEKGCDLSQVLDRVAGAMRFCCMALGKSEPLVSAA